jgi:hypothetical protein
MSTIAGVAFRLFDCLPKEGDKVRYEGYEFIAREVTGLRISKIQVRKIVADEEASTNHDALEDEMSEEDEALLDNQREAEDLELKDDSLDEDSQPLEEQPNSKARAEEVKDELER